MGFSLPGLSAITKNLSNLGHTIDKNKAEAAAAGTFLATGNPQAAASVYAGVKSLENQTQAQKSNEEAAKEQLAALQIAQIKQQETQSAPQETTITISKEVIYISGGLLFIFIFVGLIRK